MPLVPKEEEPDSIKRIASEKELLGEINQHLNSNRDRYQSCLNEVKEFFQKYKNRQKDGGFFIELNQELIIKLGTNSKNLIVS